MNIIDAHCDALLQLQQGRVPLAYENAKELETNANRLQEGSIKVQFFAIFIDPNVPSDQKWHHALEQIDLFYTEVLGKNKQMKHIKNWSDLDRLQENEIGAVLTLEGADAFGNDLSKLRHLYRFGVLSIGLTWNNPNLCADGAGDPRGAGLTELGKQVVKLNNEQHVLTDVSHLAEKGFWDVMELSDYPIASHSNARKLCDHPRNLYDEQIKAMFNNNGLIHVVFYPPFINEGRRDATIDDLIKHIDHLCALGGVKQIGFGSDFDGIDCYISGLENAAQYQNLVNELLKYYSEDEVRGFAYENFLNNRPFRRD